MLAHPGHGFLRSSVQIPCRRVRVAADVAGAVSDSTEQIRSDADTGIPAVSTIPDGEKDVGDDFVGVFDVWDKATSVARKGGVVFIEEGLESFNVAATDGNKAGDVFGRKLRMKV